MEKKEDLRVIKTKRLIKEVFLSLVEERGYEHVTITDIAQAAFINRNTFYLHYDGKEDLIESIIGDMGNEINNRFSSFLIKHPMSNMKITKTIIRVGIRKVLQIVDEEIELIRILFLDESLKGVSKRLSDKLKHTVASYFGIKNYKKSIYFEYCFEGVFGVVRQWTIYYTYSLTETSRILSELVYNDLFCNIANGQIK